MHQHMSIRKKAKRQIKGTRRPQSPSQLFPSPTAFPPLCVCVCSKFPRRQLHLAVCCCTRVCACMCVFFGKGTDKRKKDASATEKEKHFIQSGAGSFIIPRVCCGRISFEFFGSCKCVCTNSACISASGLKMNLKNTVNPFLSIRMCFV